MSVQAVTWAIGLRDVVKSPTHKCILILLGNYADENAYCWPSQKTIAAEARCGDRTVRTVLADLEAAGLITRTQRKRPNGSFSTDGIVLNLSVQNTTNSVQRQDLPKAKNPRRQRQILPAANPANGKIRPNPAANLAGLTSLEPTIEPKDSCPKAAAPFGTTGELFGETLTPSKPKSGAHKRAAYTPEFEAFWKSWPKARRELSDKRKAFERWSRAEWDAPTLMGAARHYLSRPDVTKDGWRYCVLAEVFLNGKLDAAVEAYLENGKSVGDGMPESQKRRYYELTGKWREEWGPRPVEPKGLNP
jgi:hypothetical protein